MRHICFFPLLAVVLFFGAIGPSPQSTVSAAYVIPQDETCQLFFKVYARAMVEKNQTFLNRMNSEYWRCMMERFPSGLDSDEQSRVTLRYLRSLEQVGANVRLTTYEGKIKLSPTIVAATGLILREMPSRLSSARTGFWSSGVRTPRQQIQLLEHPLLGSQAILNSMHLGGMAADLAWPTRRVSLSRIGEVARDILKQHGYGNKVRVVPERYCIHIELTPGLARLQTEDLHRQGVLRRMPTGHHPLFKDYLPAPEDNGFDPATKRGGV